MDSDESQRDLSPTVAILANIAVEINEDLDENTIMIGGDASPIADDCPTDSVCDPITDLDNIEKMINGFEDNDSDVEIVVERGECDSLLMGSQLLRRKMNSVDAHRQCRLQTAHEKQIRIELQQELELERQQRIQFQQQLQEYMQASLKRQFEDSGQIKQLKLELLKCKQQLQMSKTHTETNGVKELLNDSLFSNKITDNELHCRDCGHVIKSEVSMILHMINHNVPEQHLHLSTTIFKLDDCMSYANSVCVLYCCPRCNASFNSIDIYYHLYKCHTKEQPLMCTSCNIFCTHLDYLREHHQQAHDGIVQNVIYANISSNLSKPIWQRSAIYKGCHNSNSKNCYKPYPSLRSQSKASNGSSCVSVAAETNTALPSFDNNSDEIVSEFPEIIQIPDSPTPAMQNQSMPSKQPIIGVRGVVADLECTFADCDFKTSSKDKLEFHISAHTNSKFKCPYCPYVGNVLNDIYRHIQKSKKHEGLKIYECRECDYGTNCASTFKEHLGKRHFNDSDDEEDVSEYIANMFRNEHSTNSEKSDSP